MLGNSSSPNAARINKNPYSPSLLERAGVRLHSVLYSLVFKEGWV